MIKVYFRSRYKRTDSFLTARVIRRYLIISCSVLSSFKIKAQADSVSLASAHYHTATQPDSTADIWDVYYRFINKKGHRSTEQVQTGFHPSVFPELAYALQTGFAVGLNANLSFTSANPEQNISVITTTPQYTQYHQIIIPVVTNLWTKNNRYNIIGDWRYYQYSADNFGLGGKSSANVDDRLLYSYLRIYQSVLRQVAPNFSVGIGYALDYHWNIREENNTPQLNDDFQRYGSPDRTVSSGLTFSMQYTNRRNLNNPQNGFYGNVMFRPNITLLGSDQNWQSLLIDLRKYVPLSSDARHILAFWSMSWLNFGQNAPYLDLPSTGWDTYSNMGRGYTQGRFRGQKLIYFETEYRTAILRNGLIGGVVFANVQTYSDWPGNRFGQLIPAAGVGLRIKVNKHSNLNFACDYAFGIGGSQGLFLNLGEVF